MAVMASEIQSLEEIHYKSKVKMFIIFFLGLFLFLSAFINFYPVGDKFKTILKSQLQGKACNPDYDQIKVSFFFPKIVVTDLNIPASCLNREGAAITLSHLTINYNLINFSPFGLPFKIDTEIQGQPLSLYYVLGFGNDMLRIKDQTIVLSRLQSLTGSNIKLSGSVTVDLSATMAKQQIRTFSLKAASKDLQIPAQTLFNFSIPSLKMNKLFIEATTENFPKLIVDKLILGDENSPVRANYAGKIDVQKTNIALSAIDLVGEVGFSDTLKQSLPLDELLKTFTQKDGFYQMRLGGTLGNPRTGAP